MQVDDDMDKTTDQQRFVVKPNADKFAQNGLEWIDCTGGETNLTIQDVIKNLAVDPEQSKKDLALIQKLLNLLFVQNKAKFLSTNFLINYHKDAFLERTFFTPKKKFTVSDLVEFYAHLVAMDADIAFSIPVADKMHYIRQGILNHLGQSTPLFRQHPICQGLFIAKSQWEGMQPEKPLILLYDVLSRIAKDSRHRSCKVASKLLPTLKRTIYLKENETLNFYNHTASMTYCDKLATYIMRQQLGSKEAFLVHSGHLRHTFYVNVLTHVKKEEIEINFVINNFNSTAIEMNQQVNEEENDFYPYINRLVVVRQERNGRVRKNFHDEIKQVSFYFMMIHRSSTEKRFYIKQISDKKITRSQRKTYERTLKYLEKKQNKQLLLEHMLKHIVDVDGFFSWKKFRQFVKEKLFNDFIDQLTENIWKTVIADEKIHLYLLQHIQTLICLDVLYHPDLYGCTLLLHKPDLERTFPSYPIQRMGNCTVHNLKAALYIQNDLSWHRKDDYQLLLHLNIDIDMMVIKIVRDTVPDIERKIPDISKLSMPIPVSKISSEIECAKKLRDQGKLEEAKDILLKACKEDPEETYAFAHLGMIYEQLHQLDKALDAYLKALELTDNDPDIWSNCAIVYSQKGQVDKAMECFDEAIKYNPFSPNIYLNRGHLLYEQKEYQRCLEDINELLKLEPDNAEHILLRGKLLLDMCNVKQGIVDVNRAYDMGLRSNDLYFTAFKIYYQCFEYFYDQIIYQHHGEFFSEFAENLQQMKITFSNMIQADGGNINNEQALGLLKTAHQKLQNYRHLELENKFLFWSCIRKADKVSSADSAEMADDRVTSHCFRDTRKL